jgi:hypothetical protein
LSFVFYQNHKNKERDPAQPFSSLGSPNLHQPLRHYLYMLAHDSHTRYPRC